jgi:urease accessory protein
MHTALRRTLLLISLVPGFAFAHPSPDHVLSFASGISHPFGGLDHLLAMIAVGMMGARLKGRAIWVLPLTFMTMLAVGALTGMGHTPAAWIEVAIAASIIAFGVLLAAKRHPSWITASAVVGTFALAHGYAHGTEAVTASGASYVIGMLSASAALHALGICVVVLMTRLNQSKSESALRAIGAALAIAGAGLLLS